MFTSNTKLFENGAAGGYAVGAFNTNNLEITKAILQVADAERAPVIVAVTPSAFKYAGVDPLAAIVRSLTRSVSVPVSLHLDHGTEFEHAITAIRAGFSSVMIDSSKLPYEENIQMTKKVVEVAAAVGVHVEAELGRLVGTEDHISVSEREASMTDPAQAADFVERTGIGSLAVSIGNAHGWYKGKPDLDFDRLRKIKELVDIHLVLHGASGIPDDDIRTASEIGIRKINIDTEIRDAFKRGVAEFTAENPDVIDPRKILKPAIDNMKEIVQKKVRLFGSAGRA